MKQSHCYKNYRRSTFTGASKSVSEMAKLIGGGKIRCAVPGCTARGLDLMHLDHIKQRWV